MIYGLINTKKATGKMDYDGYTTSRNLMTRYCKLVEELDPRVSETVFEVADGAELNHYLNKLANEGVIVDRSIGNLEDILDEDGKFVIDTKVDSMTHDAVDNSWHILFGTSNGASFIVSSSNLPYKDVKHAKDDMTSIERVLVRATSWKDYMRELELLVRVE